MNLNPPYPEKSWTGFYIKLREEIFTKGLDSEEYGDNLIVDIQGRDGQKPIKVTLGAIKIMAMDELIESDILGQSMVALNKVISNPYDTDNIILAERSHGKLKEILG